MTSNNPFFIHELDNQDTSMVLMPLCIEQLIRNVGKAAENNDNIQDIRSIHKDTQEH